MYEESGDYDYSDYNSNFYNTDSQTSQSADPNSHNSDRHAITTIKIPLMEPLLILEYFLRSSEKTNSTAFDLRLDEYGCWCSNLAQHGTAIQGYPIDQIDSACRRWSKCRNCMRAHQDVCPIPFDPNEQYLVRAKDFTCLDPRFDEVEGSLCASQCCKCDFNLAKDVMVSLDSYDDRYVNISPGKGGGLQSKFFRWPNIVAFFQNEYFTEKMAKFMSVSVQF